MTHYRNGKEYCSPPSQSDYILKQLRNRFQLNKWEYKQLKKIIRQASFAFRDVIEEMYEKFGVRESAFYICAQTLYNNVLDLRLTKDEVLDGVGFTRVAI